MFRKFLPERDQVLNEANGYVFQADEWVRLDRFLILGSDKGNYYVTPRKLTEQDAANVRECIKQDGQHTVERIVQISAARRAPSNEAALLALAMCMAYGDEDTRRSAEVALPDVARIPTHLFHFEEYVAAMRGRGKIHNRAIANWYNSKNPRALAELMVKYQGRDGWRNRDLLRLARPTPETGQHNAIYRWITKGAEALGVLFDDPGLQPIWAFEQAQKAISADQIVRLITQHRLPREAIPTQFLNQPSVWEALLPHMKAEALLRNLGKMTSIGLIAPLSTGTQLVVAKLAEDGILRDAHPVKFLNALQVYQQGHGDKGKLTWIPDQQVVQALNAAVNGSFCYLTPSGARFIFGMDVSGSMRGKYVVGLDRMPTYMATAVMASCLVRAEKRAVTLTFNTVAQPFDVGPQHDLINLSQRMAGMTGNTDCSAVIRWAIQNKVETDVIAIMTDVMHWEGENPHIALREYRRKINPNVKFITIAMCSSKWTLGNPNDALSFDIAGFDTYAPSLITGFASDD